MEEFLRTEIEKLELIIGGLNAGIWDWQIDQNKEWWSSRMYELLGYEPGEISPSFNLVQELLHPDDRLVLSQAVERHLKQQGLFRIEYRLKHKNGDYRWFEASAKATFDKAGKPTRICGSLVDITEKMKLRVELERKATLLQELGAMTHTGGWETDLITRQTRWSRELFDIFGVADDFPPSMEMIMDFFAVESQPIIRQRVKEALRNGKEWEEELRFITGGNQEIWVRSIGKPLFDAEGKVIGLRGVLQNINKRKQAEQLLKASEEKFRTMFELAPVGMTLTDLGTGNFLDYNQAFLNMLGYSANEAPPYSFQQITPEDFMPAARDQVDLLLHNGVYGPFEIEHIRKDGQRLPVLLNGALVKDHQGHKSVWSFSQDISRIKRREQVIANLNEELRELNKQKDQLFSIISHDLKSSIGNTHLLIDLLNEQVASESADTCDILKKARTSISTAQALLDDLLLWSLSQMDALIFAPASLPLQAIVTQVFKSCRPQAENKNLQLQLEMLPGTRVQADEQMLKVILRNLISNAIKFSYPQGQVTVKAWESDGLVTIAVHDEGTGIVPENIPKLFDKKKHLSTKGTKGEKGSGLGLILCQEFAQKHNTRIVVESQVQQGCTFTFSLPKP